MINLSEEMRRSETMSMWQRWMSRRQPDIYWFDGLKEYLDNIGNAQLHCNPAWSFLEISACGIVNLVGILLPEDAPRARGLILVHDGTAEVAADTFVFKKRLESQHPRIDREVIKNTSGNEFCVLFGYCSKPNRHSHIIMDIYWSHGIRRPRFQPKTTTESEPLFPFELIPGFTG